MNDCDKSSVVQVTSYDFTVVNGTTKSFQGKGNGNFSQEMLEALKNLPAGKKIYIDNIRVKYPDGSLVEKVGGLTVTIK